MNWTNLFRRRPPVPPPQIQIVQRELVDLSVEEWRREDQLRKDAAAILINPRVRQMLCVCRNELVRRMTYDARLPVELKAAIADRSLGFADALRVFESLALKVPERGVLEATWAPENSFLPPKK